MHYRPYSSFRLTPVGHLRVNSPFGQLELTASTQGLVAVLPMGRNLPDRWATVVPDMSRADRYAIAQHLARAREELAAYFRGHLTRFTTPVDISHGTDFQQQVWRQLQQLDYGESCSYQAIADAIGRPKAVRAVGTANGANQLAIVVPCHRVVGKNGKLTGYAYGLEMKQYLLDMEQKRSAAQK